MRKNDARVGQWSFRNPQRHKDHFTMLGEGLGGKFIWGNLLLYLSMITKNFVPDIEKVFQIGNLEKLLCLLSHEGPILTAFFYK